MIVPATRSVPEKERASLIPSDTLTLRGRAITIPVGAFTAVVTAMTEGVTVTLAIRVGEKTTLTTEIVVVPSVLIPVGELTVVVAAITEGVGFAIPVGALTVAETATTLGKAITTPVGAFTAEVQTMVLGVAVASSAAENSAGDILRG